MADAIKIDGLDQFVRSLKKLDADLPKALRIGFNDAAGIIVDYGKAHMPRRTGRASATIRAASTRTAVRVKEGGRRAPYVPWLDFGGKVGRGKATKRPFYKEGRFLYPALRDRGDAIHEAIVKALLDTARGAGVEVD